jgi:hypothetical protein
MEVLPTSNVTEVATVKGGRVRTDTKHPKAITMSHFYEPDLSVDLDSPFIRDGANKLVRRPYWMDMDDRTLVMVMVSGIGCHPRNARI